MEPRLHGMEGNTGDRARREAFHRRVLPAAVLPQVLEHADCRQVAPNPAIGASREHSTRPGGCRSPVFRPIDVADEAMTPMHLSMDASTRWAALLVAGLWRSPVRTVLTAASLAMAFLMLGLLTPILLLFEGGAAVTAADTRLLVQPRHSIADFLPVRHADAVARIAGTGATVAHLTWFGGRFRDDEAAFPRWAVPPAAFLAAMPELVLPAAARQAFMTSRTGVIVGRRTAERHGLQVGDGIVLVPDIWPHRQGEPWRFEVVGIFDATDSRIDTSAMYIDYGYFDSARAWGQGSVSLVLVRPGRATGAGDGDAAGDLARRIDAGFANSADETTTASERAYALSFARQLGDVGTMLGIVLGAVLFAITVVAMHTMAQAIRERRVELATLRALGFPAGLLARLVCAEALALTLLGALPGLALAWGLQLLARDLFPTLALSMGEATTLLLVAGSTLAIALVAGLPPALRARRDDIADALRASQGH